MSSALERLSNMPSLANFSAMANRNCHYFKDAYEGLDDIWLSFTLVDSLSE